jgi:hypothetical protein
MANISRPCQQCSHHFRERVICKCPCHRIWRESKV